jgi:glyceraldehyde-3-phosphate dehydrogenase/erythrose-4-phosphate dehydrogenase
MPDRKGKLDGTAIRIPTPNVSLVSPAAMIEHQRMRQYATPSVISGRRRMENSLEAARAGHLELK